MVLGPRLDLRQTQALVMTPQLQQAIKLLQFSSLELSAYVDQQLEQNPLLEAGEAPTAGDEAGGTGDAPPADAADGNDGGDPRALDRALADDSPDYAGAGIDSDFYDNVFDNSVGAGDAGSDVGGGATWQSRNGTFDDRAIAFEDMLAGGTSLREVLSGQLAVDIVDPAERLIGHYLIDLLDDAGYLSADLSLVSDALGCSQAQVEATLAKLQTFEPAGIFARSLAECLGLQLADRGRLDIAMQTLLDHLDLVAKRDWASLARICGVEHGQILKMAAEIRTLSPKPALAFDHVVSQPVVPDVMMRPQQSGGWVVELNSETLPRVLVNNQYYVKLNRSARTREDKQYIAECMQTANWLVKSLHQRATTILKVSAEIVRQQESFFINGVHSLRPLILRDIAEAIGMHESTVSRVTSNKFMATPRGIFELKYFFTHAVGGLRGGDIHSAESVRHHIKALIEAETVGGILSDDGLADLLQKEGIDIARRTVAKYREAMGIPSSVQRRREKDALHRYDGKGTA
ncbi:MAG: RNA polymerase factor sigma-54 [Rhodospirillales bacterium]|nr:RNA polymerase factor sigma-54 [Rhodospirillales bacterium]